MTTVYYIYDGMCPLCKSAAKALRIKQAAGRLELINARHDHDHPVLQDILAKGFDLDQGSVLRIGGQDYYAEDCLFMMSMISSGQGWFNRMNILLFRHRKIAAITYPFLRGGRKALLFVLRRPMINAAE